jgi:prepilin-type processing-associated H-X9-DG protein
MSTIRQGAQKLRDASNLKKIAEAWKTYTVDNNFGTIPVSPRGGEPGGAELMRFLSGGSVEDGWKGQDHCILNDPYVYLSPGDKYASKMVKEALSSPEGREADASLVAWLPVTNELSSNGMLYSYCTIAGISASVPLDTTPIAFTRGLKANGTWHSKYGLYGSKGGYVVYCDGHVAWFDGSKPAKFVKWDKSGYTTDIRQALPNDTFISSGWLLKGDVKDSDASLLIIYNAGGNE